MKSIYTFILCFLCALTAVSCQPKTQLDPDALWQLGLDYENGTNGVIQDSAMAYKSYLQSAEAGNAIGYYLVGHCFQHGIGVEENHELSYENYKKSFDMLTELAKAKDDMIILNFLGSAYYWGDGTERNFEKAAECYLRSAEMGNPETQYKIGKCYEEGTGLEQDMDKALEWYSKSSEQGFTAAIERLQDFQK